jgi:hypothetical protein
MCKPRLLTLVLLAVNLSAAPLAALPIASTWTAVGVSATHKLTAIEPGVMEPFPFIPIRLEAARGEWECFQIVIRADDQPLTDIRARASSLQAGDGTAIDAANVQLYWEHYVLVDHPSGNRRLEKLWWPDALIPTSIAPPQPIPPHHSAALWVAVHAPANCSPAAYVGHVSLVSGGETRDFSFSLAVQPISMPQATMRANVAVYYDTLRDWYAKHWQALDETQFAAMKRAYYDFLLDYRINAYDLPVSWDSDDATRYLTDPRVVSVRLPALDNPAITAAVARLKATGTLHKAYYYYIDEPGPERDAEIRDTSAKLHALEPRLRHCITAYPSAELRQSVDIWCPNIGDYFGVGWLDMQRLATERRQGRETWWYTMVEPKYPYPTWLLDDDADAVRSYGWMMAQTGINGFVYSMAHGWGPNPYENLQSFAGTNGDGTLLYPAELINDTVSGPVPSIRLMLLRDAIEDYELLHLLPQTVRQRLTRPFGPPFLRTSARDIDWMRLRSELFHALAHPHDLSVDDNIKVPFATQSESHATFVVGKPAGKTSFPTLKRAPTIDGQLGKGEWSDSSRFQQKFSRFGDLGSSLLPHTQLWVEQQHGRLSIALLAELKHHAKTEAPASDAQSSLRGEWVAIDLAPVDATERWRFILTPAGKAVVERHTRRGHFLIEGLSWRHGVKVVSGYYTAEMSIPLEVIGSPHRFRFNALRRVSLPDIGTHIIVQAYPDAGSTRLMPLANVR